MPKIGSFEVFTIEGNSSLQKEEKTAGYKDE
jgi:hypothetical protein